MTAEDQTEVKETKSIIDPAYRDRMKGASDWIGNFLEAAALDKGVGAKAAVEAVEEVKDADGKVITEAVKGRAATKGKDVWDLDKMFALAEANGVDTAKYESAKDHPSGVGRMRMTISNMLRSRARKRHGLFDILGNWHDAPADFVDGHDRVEERDGTKIAKAKPEAKADGEAQGDAETDGADENEAGEEAAE